MENENEILEVHCLKCDHIYPEEKPQTKVCPNCGNEDMMQTVYLVSEEISKLYDEDQAMKFTSTYINPRTSVHNPHTTQHDPHNPHTPPLLTYMFI